MTLLTVVFDIVDINRQRGQSPMRSISSIRSAVNAVNTVNEVNAVQAPMRPPSADVAKTLHWAFGTTPKARR